jgi:dienelactone hydrolase
MKGLVRAAALGGLALWFATSSMAQQAVSLPRQDQRAVPAIAYPPQGACNGSTIISPGAGGSEKGYRYLGEAMASLGYLAVVVGHQESGREALRAQVRGNGLREGLAELIIEPGAYRGRFMDIAAAKQWAAGQCSGRELVLVGHSMGAATTMIEAGALNKLGLQGQDGFAAYIALSPQGSGSIFPPGAWRGIQRPVLTLTGTRDDELGGASWQTRTEPYENMSAGCKWLGVIDGASHMNLAGNGLARKTEALATQTIAAFLDALHRGDCTSTWQARGLTLKTK